MTIKGNAAELAAFVKALQKLPNAEIKIDGNKIAKGCLEAIRGTPPEKPTGA